MIRTMKRSQEEHTARGPEEGLSDQVLVMVDDRIAKG